MTAYFIVTGTPKNPDKLAAYSKAAAPTLEAAGAQLLVKGKPTALTGDSVPLAAIFTFPDKEAVERWYNSAAYQALIPLRDEGADLSFLVVEG